MVAESANFLQQLVRQSQLNLDRAKATVHTSFKRHERRPVQKGCPFLGYLHEGLGGQLQADAALLLAAMRLMHAIKPRATKPWQQQLLHATRCCSWMWDQVLDAGDRDQQLQSSYASPAA